MSDRAEKRSSGRFETVVRPHFDALYRAAMRLTRSRVEAEDLVQEVCLRAFPALDRLEGLEYPLGWLLRVQYRVFVDAARRRVRSPFVASANAAEADLALSTDPSPEEFAEASLMRQRLTRVWPELEPEQRALLALHAEGYTLAELEAMTGLSRNAVGVRLHRARARLGRLMNDEPAGALRPAKIGELT
jgi:RNA polymerase sigma factor (sigma-70 family)